MALYICIYVYAQSFYFILSFPFSLYIPPTLFLVPYPSPEAQRSFCEPSTTSRGREVSRWAEIDSTTTQLYPSRPGNPPLLVSAMCVSVQGAPPLRSFPLTFELSTGVHAHSFRHELRGSDFFLQNRFNDRTENRFVS